MTAWPWSHATQHPPPPDFTLLRFLRTNRTKRQQSVLMPPVLARSITKLHKSTNVSSQQPSTLPALSHRALSAASTSGFVTELRRSHRTRRPSTHKLESDEYKASSRGSSRPATLSGRKGNSDSQQDPRGKRGKRPGLIVQPHRSTGVTSNGGSPEPVPTPRLQRGDNGLADPGSTGDTLGAIGTAEAICRATAFLSSDASKLPARALRQILDTISDQAEATQESPMELEGVSAPAVLQSTRGMVLGSGHQPPATGTTNATDSPQGSKLAGVGDRVPLDGRSRERPRHDDTATDLSPSPTPPPLRAASIPPRPPVPPISHTLHDADEAQRSNDVRMDLDVATIDEASASDSDTAHAHKRPRLTACPQPIHLSPPRPSHSKAPSMTTRRSHLASTHSTHSAVPHSTRTTTQISGPTSAVPPASLNPPSASDLGAVLHWAAQLTSQLTRPGVTDAQGAGLSGQVAFDLVTTVLEKLCLGLTTDTTPAPRANPRQRQPQLKHTDPVEDDSKILEAEAALELGRHVRSRRKPTLADFPGLPRHIASLAMPELITVVCTQGAYEVFGTLCDWAGDTYNEVWARELGHLRLQKAPHTLKSIMVHRILWFRGETKVKVRPVVPFVFPFINPPRTREDLIHNRELAKKLLPNVFHCRDIDKPNEHQYEHPGLCDCIATAFFSAPDSIGMMFNKKFQPVPIPAVAMVLTVMQHCIKEWKTGRHVSCELNAGKQLKMYDSHLKGLLQYAGRAARRLNKFQRDWHKYGVEYAGTLPEAEELFQPTTEADHVRPDTPISDAGAEAPEE